MTSPSPRSAIRGGSGRPSSRVTEPLRRVDDDFEDEYPGASALATECFANLYQVGNMLMELHNRQSREEYGLAPSARQILAVVEGAGEPLEPSVIAERVLITTASMTSVLDTLERRGLVRRMPHPDDRRKLLVAITPDAVAILDELLPSFHARERDVISAALSTSEQRALLRLIAKVQHAARQAEAAPVSPAGVSSRNPRRAIAP
jgi:DNA-binding MarR family transcriptional regulator